MARHPNLSDHETPPRHALCLGQANPVAVYGEIRPSHAYLNDVRRCIHGKIQICIQPTGVGMVGPGTYVWSDLSRFWDRKKYKTALIVLDTGPGSV